MYSSISILLALVCCSLALKSSEDSYILGGEDAELGEFPFIGSIINTQGILVCGCVLVHSVWAVTGAHCPGNSEFVTEWGSTVFGNGTIINILAVTRHPEYGQGNGFAPNDIAVLRLEKAADALDNVAPIPLGRQRVDVGIGAIAGWGRTCSNCSFADTLQYAVLNILSDGQCASLWGEQYYGPAHICVYDPENLSISSCNGDGGGPMVTEVDGQLELHGLVSWGASGCLATQPSVNSRVSEYAEWVCLQTGNLALGCAPME